MRDLGEGANLPKLGNLGELGELRYLSNLRHLRDLRYLGNTLSLLALGSGGKGKDIALILLEDLDLLLLGCYLNLLLPVQNSLDLILVFQDAFRDHGLACPGRLLLCGQDARVRSLRRGFHLKVNEELFCLLRDLLEGHPRVLEDRVRSQPCCVGLLRLEHLGFGDLFEGTHHFRDLFHREVCLDAGVAGGGVDARRRVRRIYVHRLRLRVGGALVEKRLAEARVVRAEGLEIDYLLRSRV